MRLDTVFDVSGSALKSQMLRMEVISANLANINATSTPEGGPYRRRDVVFQTSAAGGRDTFSNLLESQSDHVRGVEVNQIINDPSPFNRRYEPHHPHAGPDGYVLYPNVNVVVEMVNMMGAARAYEASMAVILSTKSMIAKTLEIGR